MRMAEVKVVSPNVTYSDEYIEAKYQYQTTEVDFEDGKIVATPKETTYHFRLVSIAALIVHVQQLS